MARNKLDAETVAKILAELDAGESRTVVAKRYQISWTLVWLIDRRQIWKHVPRASESEEPTMEELDRMIEERYATMPRCYEGDDDYDYGNTERRVAIK